MSSIQLQTQPICPKCKKNHPMSVVAFDVLNQEIYYQTTCRIRPLVFSVSEMATTSPEMECFYLNSEGWMSYTSTHGNYVHRLSKDPAENVTALAAAYLGDNELIHTPVENPVMDEEEVE